jgi:hypothetical protein
VILSNELLDTMTSRLREWLATQAPRVRDLDVTASIRFTVQNSFCDDDGTLILALRIEEKVEDYLGEDMGLRVEGVPFLAAEEGT